MSHPHIYVNPAPSPLPPTPASPDVQAFHASHPLYAPTPLVPLPALSSSLGVGAVYIKDESSRLGLPSFKILGASYGAYRALLERLSLPPSTPVPALRAALQSRPATVYTATDGNHGRALAHAASWLGAASVVYVPAAIPAAVHALIRSEGAVVRPVDASYDGSVQLAHAAAEAEGGVCVQDTAWDGYETIPQWIVEGYATLAVEVLAQLPQPPTHVVVPVGVGSLAHAVALAFKPLGAKVVAVETEAAACLLASLRAGEPTSVQAGQSAMEGMCCGTVSSAAWPVLSRAVDACVAVGDGDARDAQRLLAGWGVRAGACGAAGLAGVTKLGAVREELGMGEASVLVILCTEGARDGEDGGAE